MVAMVFLRFRNCCQRSQCGRKCDDRKCVLKMHLSPGFLVRTIIKIILMKTPQKDARAGFPHGRKEQRVMMGLVFFNGFMSMMT